jgi:uncharacterized protein
MSRMSPERLAKAQEQLKTISKEDHAKVKAIANIVRPLRSFIFKIPDDYGMTGWRDLFIPSDDGTPLEAWYIPAKGGESDKLIIFNHLCPCAVQASQGILASHGATTMVSRSTL